MSSQKKSSTSGHLRSDGATLGQPEMIGQLSTPPAPHRAIGLVARLRGSTAASNFGWLVVDRGLRLVIGVFVGSWIARYLGHEDFGLLSYVLAFVGIFAAVAPLGMEPLIVREIIRHPQGGGRWIGTMVGFRSAAALVLAILGFLLIVILRPDDNRGVFLVVILSAGLLFQSLESSELWFQANTQMRRLVVPRLALMIVMNLLKVFSILRGAGVMWFALLTVAEQCLSGGLTWFLVRRSMGEGNAPVFDALRGLKVLRECWPLAVSALAVVLYMKVSQLIVGQMLGDAALATYAAAIRIPEAALFLPVVLASSLLPSLMRRRSENPRSYQAARIRFFRINALLAVSICLPLCLGAPWIIEWLFGAAYRDAAPIMSVYTWSLLFVFLGVARAQHLLNEGQTHLPLWYSLLGLAVNLAGCFLLIPRWGAMGAAIATVGSQAVSAFLSSFLHPSTRAIGSEQWLALITPWRLRSAPHLAPAVS